MKAFRNSLWTFLGLNYAAYLWQAIHQILFKLDSIFTYKFNAISKLVNYYLFFVAIGVGIMGTVLTAVMAIKQFKEERRIEKNIIILLILYILCLPLSYYSFYGINA